MVSLYGNNCVSLDSTLLLKLMLMGHYCSLQLSNGSEWWQRWPLLGQGSPASPPSMNASFGQWDCVSQRHMSPIQSSSALSTWKSSVWRRTLMVPCTLPWVSSPRVPSLRCIHLTNAFFFKLVQDSCNALSIYLGAYLGTCISKIAELLLATHFLLWRSTEVKYLSNVPSLQFQIHRDVDSFWNLFLPFLSTLQRNVLWFHVYLQIKGNNLCAWKQVNVSELGLVTPAGKVVWGEFSSFFKPSAFCTCWSKRRTSFSCGWSLEFGSECLLCRTKSYLASSLVCD